MIHRRESPIKRVNPSGKTVWLARYTDARGRRHSAGTYAKRGPCKQRGDGCCAQHAIDAAYGRSADRGTVRAYAETWLDRHPRGDATNQTNARRVRAVLDVEIEGRPFGDWPFDDLRRRHYYGLVDHLLRVDGRAVRGVRGILSVLSAMTEDAITDEVVASNAVRGVKVLATDPRIRKTPRPIRVWSWEQMHAFAAAAARARTTKMTDSKGRRMPEHVNEIDRWRPVYAEALIRIFTDCGMRIAEVLPLERGDLTDGVFRVQRSIVAGRVKDGTKNDRGEAVAGRDVPCPPTLAGMLQQLPARIDTRLLFPSPRGKLWGMRNFRRDVWAPAANEAGINPRPHEMRHSWITHLRAAGVDEADLAEMAGHTLATMIEHYAHAPRQSFNAVRAVIG